MQTPRSSFGLGIVAAMVLVGVVALVYVVRAPTQTIPEHAAVPQADTTAVIFDVAPFDRVCEQFVNEVGLVDYAGLKADDGDLNAFLDQVQAVSPHSNLAAFPSETTAITYWINAYNAWMLRAVLDAYPVASVMDIGDDPGVFDAKGRICGGEDFSLNEIEHEIVRKEFLEPRAHFALNCASMGCPWLPSEAFDHRRLDAQLDREAFRFFADASHLRVDAAGETVYLSSILDWYGEDFTRWLKEVKQIDEPSILDYARIYAPADIADEIADDFEVKWPEYGWGLNDQAAAWASDRDG